MSYTKPAFLFVHGAWHGAATWRRVMALLQARGYKAFALDLPGAGVHAKAPVSYGQRPLDRTAFATEPSPNAGVTQEERTRAVLSLIQEIGEPVILVGHSLGGLTISAVAEEAPERLRAVVYLTAFLVPPGMPAIAMIQHETMASSLVPALFQGDPAVIGALRLDPRSDDPLYRAQVKAAFYGDVSEADFDQALAGLHADEPAGVAMQPSLITAARFGSVPRHYIRCLEDRAIPITGQDFMIAAVDGIIGGKTHLHTMNTSHSPFASEPEKLVDLLVTIAG